MFSKQYGSRQFLARAYFSYTTPSDINWSPASFTMASLLLLFLKKVNPLAGPFFFFFILNLITLILTKTPLLDSTKCRADTCSKATDANSQ